MGTVSAWVLSVHHSGGSSLMKPVEGFDIDSIDELVIEELVDLQSFNLSHQVRVAAPLYFPPGCKLSLTISKIEFRVPVQPAVFPRT